MKALFEGHIDIIGLFKWGYDCACILYELDVF